MLSLGAESHLKLEFQQTEKQTAQAAQKCNILRKEKLVLVGI